MSIYEFMRNGLTQEEKDRKVGDLLQDLDFITKYVNEHPQNGTDEPFQDYVRSVREGIAENFPGWTNPRPIDEDSIYRESGLKEIHPDFHASICWRVCELLNNGEVKDGLMIFEDEVLKIIGPAPKDDPAEERGITALILKPGEHRYRPKKSGDATEIVKVGWPILMDFAEERGDCKSVGMYLRKDGPEWDVVDDATAAYFPNSHMWPIATR